MRANALLTAAVLVSMALGIRAYADRTRTAVPRGEAARLSDAERYLRNGDYQEAESTLTILSRRADGEELHQSLFLLAGLKSSASEASDLYRQIVDGDPEGEWSKRAQLELSKIAYALGNYGESYRLLRDGGACGTSEEACLFEGLSAIMLERFEDARKPLEAVHKGKLTMWAHISLAEVEAGLDRPIEACRRYQSLAGSMISPTALYRYAECLENRGEMKEALEKYDATVKHFRDTPEAVLAAEKLQRLKSATEAAVEKESGLGAEAAEEMPVLTSGFTIQFGSFRDRGNAIKQAAKIKRVYPGVRVDTELVNYREYHRVRFGYFKTRAEAQAKAQEISREINEEYTIMTLP